MAFIFYIAIDKNNMSENNKFYQFFVKIETINVKYN